MQQTAKRFKASEAAKLASDRKKVIEEEKAKAVLEQEIRSYNIVLKRILDAARNGQFFVENAGKDAETCKRLLYEDGYTVYRKDCSHCRNVQIPCSDCINCQFMVEFPPQKEEKPYVTSI